MTQPGYPDGVTHIPDDKLDDAIADALMRFESGVDACVFCIGVDANCVEIEDGVAYHLEATVDVGRVKCFDPSEIDTALRNALAACVHQFDMRAGLSTASATSLRLEL